MAKASKRKVAPKAPVKKPSLKAQLDEKENELAAVYKVNEELRAEIEALTAAGVKKTPTGVNISQHKFSVDGNTYGFNYPAMHYKGQRITPVEIMADENLQRELVNNKSGILKNL